MPKGIPKNGINKGWFRKGRIMSEKDRKKISESTKGIKDNLETRKKKSLAMRKRIKEGNVYLFKKGNQMRKGKIPWNKGLTKETDSRVSGPPIGHNFWGKEETLFSNRDVKLDKHPNWQGGKSFEPYSLKWTKELKETIRQRDNHTCRLCGVKWIKGNRKFIVHHIDYDKKNCDLDNLITLCLNCHLKTNFKRDYWVKVFKSIL